MGRGRCSSFVRLQTPGQPPVRRREMGRVFPSRDETSQRRGAVRGCWVGDSRCAVKLLRLRAERGPVGVACGGAVVSRLSRLPGVV
jgi:hypothetical protein